MCRRNLDIGDLEVLKKPLWNNVLTTVVLSERLATEWTCLLVHSVQRPSSQVDSPAGLALFVQRLGSLHILYCDFPNDI